MKTFSVVCPVYNEQVYITGLLSFLRDVSPSPEQIIFIDGQSNDETKSLIDDASRQDSRIVLIENPNRTVPYAMNLAIPLCTTDVIVRIDAHSDYADDYFDTILRTFEQVDADIIGGPYRTSFKAPFQEAVAYAFNTPLGMGNSSVHDINYSGYTDSVAYGAWKKQIFEKTGLFDLRLKRNQDDEFHYRARSMGFKIYQNADIKLWYFPRKNLKGLFRQYFEYGLYKPMVLRKVKSGLSLRHLVPSFFVIYLFMMLALVSIFWQIIIPLLIYFLLVAYFTLKASTSAKAKLYIPVVYPAVHLAYGIGFIFGIAKAWRL